MRKLLSLILIFSLLLSMTSCGAVKPNNTNEPAPEVSSESGNSSTGVDAETVDESGIVLPDEDIEDISPSFSQLNDPSLVQYVEDKVYEGLVNEFNSEDYIIENVEAVYVSKEYIAELEYNSKENIFFGYTLAELDEQFIGNRYVFTLGDNGQTIVVPFEDYDDTYDQVIKNVAIGTGVILICVTVSVATAGTAAPVSMVFAASAKTAAEFTLSAGAISAIFAGALEGVKTGDFDKAVKAAALAGSESFKWGAICGAIVGGFSELSQLHKTAKAVEGAKEYAQGSVEISVNDPPWRQAELRALNETGGFDQLSYLNGEQVPFGTPGATRPDVVRVVGDHIEAIEVKYYNLESAASRNTLFKELEREISARVANLPKGSTQKIILDVTDRGFSSELCLRVAAKIKELLSTIYPEIIVEIVGLA